MSDSIFLDAHPQSRAFVANYLERTAQMISDQGERLLQDAGLSFPSRASSTILFIGERGGTSAADIAAALDQPHQLVTQRIDLLIDLGLVTRIADPQDGRRKVLKLTARGLQEYGQLQDILQRTDAVFAALFEEIDCDVPAVLKGITAALARESLVDRFNVQKESL